MNKLKPCPFCGSVAKLFVGSGVKVMCTECDCQTKTYDDMSPLFGCDIWREERKSAVDEAIEAWNRRVGEKDEA